MGIKVGFIDTALALTDKMESGVAYSSKQLEVATVRLKALAARDFIVQIEDKWVMDSNRKARIKFLHEVRENFRGKYITIELEPPHCFTLLNRALGKYNFTAERFIDGLDNDITYHFAAFAAIECDGWRYNFREQKVEKISQ